MKFTNGDIVKILSLGIEGLIIDTGLDLETNKTKYFIIDENNKGIIDVEEDLVFVTTLDDQLDLLKEQNTAAAA